MFSVVTHVDCRACQVAFSAGTVTFERWMAANRLRKVTKELVEVDPRAFKNAFDCITQRLRASKAAFVEKGGDLAWESADLAPRGRVPLPQEMTAELKGELQAIRRDYEDIRRQFTDGSK